MALEKSEFSHLAPEGVEAVDLLRKKTSVKRQFLAVVAMDLLSFSYGATCGWSSAAIPFLKSDQTPLQTGPITTSEASWIASGICIGGFVGNLLIGSVGRALKASVKVLSFDNDSSSHRKSARKSVSALWRYPKCSGGF